MMAARKAIEDRLLGDSLISTVGAGSSTTVIQLGVGQAASWSKGMLASFAGAGATAANNLLVRTVVGRDTTAHTITVDSALPVAPVAADQVKGGCREWLISSLAGGAGVYEWGWDPSPADALLQTATEKRCIAMLSGFPAAPEVLARVEVNGQIDLLGLDPLWLEGLEARVLQILHLGQAGLTAAGHKIWSSRVAALPQVFRGDLLRQRTVFVDLALTRAA